MSGKVAHSLESSQTRDIQQFPPSPPIPYSSERYATLEIIQNPDVSHDWLDSSITLLGIDLAAYSLVFLRFVNESFRHDLIRVKVQGRTNGYSLHLLSKFYFFSVGKRREIYSGKRRPRERARS